MGTEHRGPGQATPPQEGGRAARDIPPACSIRCRRNVRPRPAREMTLQPRTAQNMFVLGSLLGRWAKAPKERSQRRHEFLFDWRLGEMVPENYRYSAGFPRG